jgi:hypothetical protein
MTQYSAKMPQELSAAELELVVGGNLLPEPLPDETPPEDGQIEQGQRPPGDTRPGI